MANNQSFNPTGNYYHQLSDSNVAAAFAVSDGTESSKAFPSLAANVTPTNFTATDNTDTVGGTEYSRTNGKTVKLASTLGGSGTASCNFTFTTEQDLDDCYVAFSYYVEDATDISYLQLNIRNTTSSKYFYAPNLPYDVGYHYVEYDLEGGTKVSNTPEMDKFKTARFQAVCGGSGVATIYIDDIRFIKNHTSPRCVISFDNGYDDHYDTVYPALQSRGIKGCFGVVQDDIGESGYATQAQIQTMIDTGHLICNHSYDHTLWQDADGDASYVALMYYERIEQMLRSREYFKGLGWEDTEAFYIHPSGSAWLEAGGGAAGSGDEMTPLQMQEAIRFLLQNYNVVRMTGINGNGALRPALDGTFAAKESSNLQYVFPNPGSCGRLMYAIGGAGHDLDWHKEVIDKAVAGNGLASFYWHHIGVGGDMTEADFTALLDYAIGLGVEFVTMKDLQKFGQTDYPDRANVLTTDTVNFEAGTYSPDFPDAGNVLNTDTTDGEAGTLSLPNVIYVIAGETYGVNGSDSVGTYYPTTPSDVLDTVSFGAGSAETGTWHAPELSEVVNTATFGPSSSLTGTYGATYANITIQNATISLE